MNVSRLRELLSAYPPEAFVMLAHFHGDSFGTMMASPIATIEQKELHRNDVIDDDSPAQPDSPVILGYWL